MGGEGGAPNPGEPIEGDITGDYCVDQNDYAVLERSYNRSVASGAEPKADFNDDGWVDYLDFLTLYEHWWEGC
jgi:hypothetical protein